MFFFLNYSSLQPPRWSRWALESLSQSDYKESFEIVIVEDGFIKMRDWNHKYEEKLSISYYYKENSGPGTLGTTEWKKQKEITLSYSIPIALFRSA
jgi:hypothetical protein